MVHLNFGRWGIRCASRPQTKRFVTPAIAEIRPCVFIHLRMSWLEGFVARLQCRTADTHRAHSETKYCSEESGGCAHTQPRRWGLNGKVQDTVQTLNKGCWILERNAFHEESLIKKQPRRVLKNGIIGTRKQFLDDLVVRIDLKRGQ